MAQPNQDEGTPSIDEQANLTISHPPAPTYAKKELYVNPEYIPDRSTLSASHRSREPTQSEQISESPLRPIAPATPLLLHTPLPLPASRLNISTLNSGMSPGGSAPSQPRTRHRTRKVVTEEINPADSASVAVLGMSPFMPGKDSIYNQNRLVRNEVILAQHLSRLQKTYSASESAHAQRAQDFYRVLTDHKTSIDLLKLNNQATSPIHLHPEFTALVEAHNETRKALDELTKDIASFSSTTRHSIKYLSDNVRRLTSPFPESSESVIAGPHPEHTITLADSLSSSPSLFERPLLAGVKRKRSPSGLSLNIAMPPTSQPSTSAAHSAFLSRSNSILNDSQREVVYGPIKNESDLSNPVAVGNDAVRNVGLSASMIHSIRIAPGRPEYLAIRFLKAEYACRFVDLVPFGEHSERQAFVADDQVN